MSGKYDKKKKNKKKSGTWLWIALVVCLAALAVGIWFIWQAESGGNGQTPETTDPALLDDGRIDDSQAVPAPTVEISQAEQLLTNYDLGNDLVITDLGKYTGVFMEDGTDEVLSGILMIVLKNNGEMPLEYAEITLATNAGDAKFTVSSVPAGASAVLLEQNRMEYSALQQIDSVDVQYVSFFAEPLSLCEELISLQVLDGAINISNVSGADIAGDIVIYYKNYASDLYYGGITYRVRITGGLKSDEIRQIMSEHFSASGSRIMFVQCIG